MKRSLGTVILLLCGGTLAFSADAPITFTAFFSDVNPKWNHMQDEVGKVITAKTGVTLKVEFPVGSPEQKVALIAASRQYPDLIAPKGQSSALIEAGALLDLTDLIEKHAPNIKRMLGDQIKRLRYRSTDPAIYFIPNNEAMGQVYYDPDALFKVQLDALREAGYPRVETLKDYEKVIADYVRKHPTTSDGKPTIGLSLLADDWRFVISVTNPAVWATGQRDDGEWYIDPVTLKAQEHYFRPEEREYFRWLNHMNDVGLLDPESFVQKFDQYKAKIAQGRVVALIDSDWDITDAVASLKARGLFGKAYGRFGVVVKRGTKVAYQQPTGFSGGWGIAITKACKDPVRAMKFLDWLASDEAQVLNNWGIEGKHYTVVDGKRAIPPEVLDAKANNTNEFTRKTGISNYSISLRWGDGVKDASGNYYTATFPETILKGYSGAERAALKAYGATFWADLLTPASEFSPVPWGRAWSIPIPEDSILKQHWDKEQSVVRRRIPEVVLARPADFDRLYDAFLAELKKTTGAMAEAETALVRDRMALWSK